MIVHRFLLTQTTHTAPSCVCLLWYTWNKMKPTPSVLSTQPHFFLRRFVFWPTLQCVVADGHRIQNRVASISLLNSAHTLFRSPTFVLPGNVCISLYFPSSTLLFLTLRQPTQSHIGFLPNENCIQQSSFQEGVEWGMIMCNNQEMNLLKGSRSIDHFFPRKE